MTRNSYLYYTLPKSKWQSDQLSYNIASQSHTFHKPPFIYVST